MPTLAVVETSEELSQRTALPGEVNGGLFDRFSLVHATSGGLAQRAGMSLPLTIAAAVAFEVAERSMKRRWPRAFPNPTQDTLVNSTGDVLATVAGWLLSRRLGGKRRR